MTTSSTGTNSQLKMQIPDKYLPYINIKETKTDICGSPFTIRTLKVNSVNKTGDISTKRKWGFSEDETYARFPELVEIMPRSYSSLIDGTGKTVVTLRGLSKFIATTGFDDEDGDEMVQENTSVFQTLQSWEASGKLKVSFSEKLNGKFAIGMVFTIWIKGKAETLLFGGSKNVHVCIPLFQEITGTDLHWRILKLFQRDVADMLLDAGDKESEQIEMMGEYCDNCHVIYDQKFSIPNIVYFEIVVSMSVGQCINYYSPVTRSRLSLPTANFILPSQKTLPTSQQLQALRELENTEGVVIHFHNTVTGEKIRQKHKTIYYVLLRALRELCCHGRTEGLKEKIDTRFRERSESFLNAPEDSLLQWIKLAHKFVDFMMVSKDFEFKDLSFQSETHGMARAWRAFENWMIAEALEFTKPEKKEFSSTLDDHLGLPEKTQVPVPPYPTPSILLIEGPIKFGKSSHGEQISRSLPGSVHIDGDHLGLTAELVFLLGQERNDYTVWCIFWTILNRKIPIVSTGGGVFCRKKELFALPELLTQCFSRDFDIHGCVVGAVVSSIDGESEKLNLPYMDTQKLKLVIERAVQAGHFEKNDSKHLVETLVKKSLDNQAFVKAMCQKCKIHCLEAVTPEEHFKMKDDVVLLPFSLYPSVSIDSGLFRQVRLLVKVNSWIKHITLRYNDKGFSVTRHDIRHLKHIYSKKIFEGQQFTLHSKTPKPKQIQLIILKDQDAFAEKGAHVTMNSGCHKPELMRKVTLDVLDGKTETHLEPQGKSDLVTYEFTSASVVQVDVVVLDVFCVV